MCIRDKAIKKIILTEHYPGQSLWLRWLIVVAGLLLVAGVYAPIITLEKFYIIENTFSVLTGLKQLLSEGQWFIFLVVAGFSVILPIIKLIVLFKLVSMKSVMNNELKRYLHWMHIVGKWSMLDVFVVAVLVVSVKLGAIANVEVRYGLYVFAAAVILTMLVTARINSLTSSER